MTYFRIGVMMILSAISVQLAGTQQGTGGPGGPVPNKQEIVAKLENIAAELQLSPQQKKQMLPILMAEAAQLKAVKENASLGPLDKLMQVKQIAGACDARIMPILDPVQQQKWQAMRQEARQQMLQKLQRQ